MFRSHRSPEPWDAYAIVGLTLLAPALAGSTELWAMALLTLTILSANSLLGKKMGAVFRV